MTQNMWHLIFESDSISTWWIYQYVWHLMRFMGGSLWQDSEIYVWVIMTGLMYTLIFVAGFMLTELDYIILCKSFWPSEKLLCICVLDKIHSLDLFALQNDHDGFCGFFSFFPFQNLLWLKNTFFLRTEFHCCHNWILHKATSVSQRDVLFNVFPGIS